MANDQLGETHHHAFIRLKSEEKQGFLGNSSSSFLRAHEAQVFLGYIVAWYCENSSFASKSLITQVLHFFFEFV